MSTAEDRESIILENDGQKIFGVLHVPRGVEKPPCVLICHGLAGHKTGRYRVYVELAEALTRAEIAAVRFDFRGSGDSEGGFDEMTLAGEISDATKMLAFLQKDTRFNADKIGVFGRSLGGAVAVHSAARFGSIASIALWAPMYSGDQWRHLWEKIVGGQASDHESKEMRRINGQVASIAFWQEVFGMRIDHELKLLKDVPLLLIHGEKDELISIRHSESYAEQRHHGSARTDFVRLSNADHDFTFTDERAQAVETTVKFFRETLF